MMAVVIAVCWSVLHCGHAASTEQSTVIEVPDHLMTGTFSASFPLLSRILLRRSHISYWWNERSERGPIDTHRENHTQNNLVRPENCEHRWTDLADIFSSPEISRRSAENRNLSIKEAASIKAIPIFDLCKTLSRVAASKRTRVCA